MKKYINTLTILILLFLSIASCKKQSDKEEGKNQKDKQEESNNKIELSKEQLEVTGIELGKPEMRNLQGMISCNGTLELPPQNKAAISSFTGGMVSRIFVIQGTEVKKYETLALIENPEIIKMQENYLQAWGKLQYAQKEYERQKTLSDEKVVAIKKFQMAETEYLNQKAVTNSLEGQLRLLHINPSEVRKGKFSSSVPLKTPIGGFINKINISTGAYVEPATELFSVVDNHHVHIDLHVFEKDAEKIKVDQKVLFGFSEKGEKPYQAEVFAVGKAYDEQTRSISVHAEIRKNKDHSLMPGMFVHARIITDSIHSKTIPDEAIVTKGEINFVYALTDTIAEKDTMFIFEKYAVKTGMADNGFSEFEFIDKPDKAFSLVTKGAYYLKSIEIRQQEGEGGGHGH